MLDFYRGSLKKVRSFLKKYPLVFNQALLKDDLLERLEACVDTRVFGSSRIKSCSMIPFCDAINHSCVRNSNQSVNKTLHLQGPEAAGSYFTPKKFAINYSIVFGETDQLEQSQQDYVKGLFNRDLYEQNQPAEFGKFSAENPELGIWEMPWIIEKWAQQDNDDLEIKDCDTDEDE